MTKFDKWFKEQFGKRQVSLASDDILQGNIQKAESDLFYYKRIQEECERYDANYRAARYAWNAKGRGRVR